MQRWPDEIQDEMRERAESRNREKRDRAEAVLEDIAEKTAERRAIADRVAALKRDHAEFLAEVGLGDLRVGWDGSVKVTAEQFCELVERVDPTLAVALR